MLRDLKEEEKLKDNQSKDILLQESLLQVQNYKDFQKAKKKENLIQQENYRKFLDFQVVMIFYMNVRIKNIEKSMII